MDSLNEVSQPVVVNPAVLINRVKKHFYAWAPAFEKPAALTIPDILLLGTFLSGRLPDSPFPAATSPVIVGLFNQLGADYLRPRVSDFLAHGLLTSTDANKTNSGRVVSSQPPRPRKGHDGGINPSDRLMLRLNMALWPSADGFLIWSVGQQEYFPVSSVTLVFMLMFEDGRTVDEILSACGLNRSGQEWRDMLNWCLDTGCLVAVGQAVEGADSERAKRSGRRKAGRKASNVASHSSKFTWENLKPDGRIPVYSVAHSPTHFPVALGMLIAHAKVYKEGVLNRKFQFLPICFMKPREYIDRVYRRFGPGVWMFSNYIWSMDFNLNLAAAIRRNFGHDNVTIHGGPSTPKYVEACEQFMRDNPFVDIAVRGEGESTTAHVLECLSERWDAGSAHVLDSLEAVSGITYSPVRNNSSKLIRTGDRPRAEDVGAFPSPYLTNEFAHYGEHVVAATIETNRGCPFGCTFCDWGSATLGKIKNFALDRVRREIEWIGRQQIRVIWIADANFGIVERDIEVARMIAETNEEYGYPVEVVVNYTKNATRRLAEIIRIFSAQGLTAQGIISIQSTDEQTLKDINRSNIKTEKYDELAEIFRNENLPLSTDLMYGLPGMTVDSFKRDLQCYFDKDISVKAYPTQLLPNSPMADPDYLRKYEIKVDRKSYLISTYSYSEADLREMRDLFTLFDMFEGHALLRCVLRYLQWDHGISATEYIHELHRTVLREPSRYPVTTWLVRFFFDTHRVPGGWRPFFDEIASFTWDRFSIRGDSGFEAVLQANTLLMPEQGRDYPAIIALEHDIVAYFSDHSRGSKEQARPLRRYPPGRLAVEDPHGYSRMKFDDVVQYDSHQVFFELVSPISRLHSSPHFEKLPSRAGA